MKKNELIEFLRCQNDFLQEKLDEALASVNSLTLANEKLTATVDELRRQIASLENLLRGKDAEVNKEKAARLAVQRLQGSSSERLGKPAAAGTKDAEKKRERNRTNNGARKKSHPECEVEIVEVEPDSPGFNPELAKYIGVVDAVRYSMTPMRFIKTIYRQKKYVQDGKSSRAPLPPHPCSTRNTHPHSSPDLPNCGIFMACHLKMWWITSGHTASTLTRVRRRNSSARRKSNLKTCIKLFPRLSSKTVTSAETKLIRKCVYRWPLRPARK